MVSYVDSCLLSLFSLSVKENNKTTKIKNVVQSSLVSLVQVPIFSFFAQLIFLLIHPFSSSLWVT